MASQGARRGKDRDFKRVRGEGEREKYFLKDKGEEVKTEAEV